MNNFLRTYLPCALLMVSSAALAAEEITDPLEHFTRVHTFRPEDRVVRVDADLDGDRVAEVLISLERYTNAKAGLNWDVYVPEASGFRRAEEIVSFRPDAFYVGWVPELDDYALMTFQAASVDSGTLVSIRSREGEIRTERVRELDRTKPEDRALYERYFAQDRADSVRRYSMDDLRELGFDVQLAPQKMRPAASHGCGHSESRLQGRSSPRLRPEAAIPEPLTKTNKLSRLGWHAIDR